MTGEQLEIASKSSVEVERKPVFAVYGHDNHRFRLLISDLVNGILPNAPQCAIYEGGKRCQNTSSVIELVYSDL